MTAATRTSTVEATNEDLVLNATLPVKGWIKGIVTMSDPGVTSSGTANSTESAISTGTLTGVAAGDVVLGFGVVSGLTASTYPTSVYVSGTDTISCCFTTETATGAAVGGAAVVLNVIVADVT